MDGCTCVPVTVTDAAPAVPWMLPAPVIVPPACSANVSVIVPPVTTPVHVPDAEGVLGSVELSPHAARARAKISAAASVRIVASAKRFQLTGPPACRGGSAGARRLVGPSDRKS